MFAKIWYHPRFRSLFFQSLFIVLLFFCIKTIWGILQQNLAVRDVGTGFGFLSESAGFNIIQHLIFYDEQSSYFRVFLVGLLNTLLVSGIGIMLATIVGVLIGVARVSSHRLLRTLAIVYVQTLRNIPLLLQLFIWYFVVLRAAPLPLHHLDLFNAIYITNRGIYIPQPITTFDSLGLLVIFFAFLCAGFFSLYLNRKTCFQLGKNVTFYYFMSIGFYFAAAVFIGLFIRSLQWEMPTLGRFNFEGGINLLPEFLALLLALTFFTAAYISEVVRMGLLSVPKGQWEAATALGFSKWQTLRLIIIPQSLKVILPPLTNQYLNLIKNSSLATAIAYPDLVSIFAGTALNQTGQAIEIIAMTMAVYLFISVLISLMMLTYERATLWGKK
ncbi:MAG: ABC transporter permease subunit [Proteobacteria bacterium]|nr:ABC transporter permease subunit [Pseudomonadota bacterium]